MEAYRGMTESMVGGTEHQIMDRTQRKHGQLLEFRAG
jgi:hypothetical protein